MQIVLMRWINQAFMLGPQTWVRLITLKKQRNIQNILRISERKLSKDYFLKGVSALKMISTQFWIRFWIHSNKFHDKVFAKALFLMSFLVYAIFEKYDFDFSWQIQVYSTFWYVIKHTYGVQKDTEQNFDTYEYPIWAINHNLRTFLKSSKPFVLFISDMSLLEY